mmetsp:Transcript_1801/g.4448  ORF Transcript_1801/g.4448 Transcript_1801/m.4448 type:complete len:97 (-) Transcript_1801:163-453(-)
MAEGSGETVNASPKKIVGEDRVDGDHAEYADSEIWPRSSSLGGAVERTRRLPPSSFVGHVYTSRTLHHVRMMDAVAFVQEDTLVFDASTIDGPFVG